MNNATKIEITGKVNYEDEITIGQAAKIITFLNAEEAGASELEDAVLDKDKKPNAPNPKKVESAREALDISGATKNPEKIVALGAYVLQDGGDTFKSEDLKVNFRRARETPPGNLSRDLSSAIASGWIAEDRPGEYYLTNKVAAVLDGGFSFPKTSTSGRVSAGAKGGKAKAKPETLADIHVFDSTLEGYIPYTKLKTEKDRLLWVVLYMRDAHQRVGVSNKEIAFVSDRLGVGIPSGNVNGAFRGARSGGYANRSTQDDSVRITDAGVVFLKSLSEKAEG